MNLTEGHEEREEIQDNLFSSLSSQVEERATKQNGEDWSGMGKEVSRTLKALLGFVKFEGYKASKGTSQESDVKSFSQRRDPG